MFNIDVLMKRNPIDSSKIPHWQKTKVHDRGSELPFHGRGHIPGVPKNVPHLNLEYLQNYARDVLDFWRHLKVYFMGIFYALTNTFPVMKQLGIKRRKCDSPILLQIRF